MTEREARLPVSGIIEFIKQQGEPIGSPTREQWDEMLRKACEQPAPRPRVQMISPRTARARQACHGDLMPCDHAPRVLEGELSE